MWLVKLTGGKEKSTGLSVPCLFSSPIYSFPPKPVWIYFFCSAVHFSPFPLKRMDTWQGKLMLRGTKMLCFS